MLVAAFSLLVTGALVACGTTPGVDGGTGGGATGGGATGGGSTGGGSATGGGGGATGGGGGGSSFRCTASTPACRDQATQALSFRTVPNDGGFTEEGGAAGALTYIDARAGGAAVPQSYIYLRFATAGLEKVLVNDEQALASLDWDIALRRFVIRVNSGNSGPSCVEVAKLASGTSYASVTAVPSGLSFKSDVYFGAPPDGGTSACDLQVDPSGINGPNTALASFWEYPVACVAMTGNVYVLHLRDGRYVKFQVQSYYSPAAQAACNDAGVVDPPTAGAANYRVRWAIIPGP